MIALLRRRTGAGSFASYVAVNQEGQNNHEQRPGDHQSARPGLLSYAYRRLRRCRGRAHEAP